MNQPNVTTSSTSNPTVGALCITPAAKPESRAEMMEILLDSVEISFMTTKQDILQEFENFEFDLPVREAHQLFNDFVKARRAQEATWGTTDCDRVDAAFAELDQNGIVAAQHYACCGNCGHHGLQQEVEEMQRRGRDVKGYVFFHVQSTDWAVESGDLWLRHGPAGDWNRKRAVAVGRKITETLRRHGLKVEWNSNPKRAILVKLKDWKKRLQLAAHPKLP